MIQHDSFLIIKHLATIRSEYRWQQTPLMHYRFGQKSKPYSTVSGYVFAPKEAVDAFGLQLQAANLGETRHIWGNLSANLGVTWHIVVIYP